jgi:hypothetical protein
MVVREPPARTARHIPRENRARETEPVRESVTSRDSGQHSKGLNQPLRHSLRRRGPRQPFGFAFVGNARLDEDVMAGSGTFHRLPFALLADGAHATGFSVKRHHVDNPGWGLFGHAHQGLLWVRWVTTTPIIPRSTNRTRFLHAHANIVPEPRRDAREPSVNPPCADGRGLARGRGSGRRRAPGRRGCAASGRRASSAASCAPSRDRRE